MSEAQLKTHEHSLHTADSQNNKNHNNPDRRVEGSKNGMQQRRTNTVARTAVRKVEILHCGDKHRRALDPQHDFEGKRLDCAKGCQNIVVF